MSLPIVKNERGFTLLELMVVMVVLAIVSIWVLPKVLDKPDEARQLKAQVTISNLEGALKMYYLDNGTYPSTEQGLEALISEPSTEPLPRKYREGGYLDKSRVPKDPWGNDFIYLSPGNHGDFDIISYGADALEGGEGKDADIESWNLE